jgi:hypothetical protein
MRLTLPSLALAAIPMSGLAPLPAAEALVGIPGERSATTVSSGDFGALALTTVSEHVLHGTYETETVGDFLRHRPTGSGPHRLEYVTPEGVTVLWEIEASGEVFLTPDEALVDFRRRDRLTFDATGEASRCYGFYTGVRAVLTSGDCWGDPVYDLTNGNWVQRCDQGAGADYTAVIHFTDASLDPITPTWECGTDPGRKVMFAPGSQNHTASVHDASGGC